MLSLMLESAIWQGSPEKILHNRRVRRPKSRSPKSERTKCMNKTTLWEKKITLPCKSQIARKYRQQSDSGGRGGGGGCKMGEGEWQAEAPSCGTSHRDERSSRGNTANGTAAALRGDRRRLRLWARWNLRTVDSQVAPLGVDRISIKKKKKKSWITYLKNKANFLKDHYISMCKPNGLNIKHSVCGN